MFLNCVPEFDMQFEIKLCCPPATNTGIIHNQIHLLINQQSRDLKLLLGSWDNLCSLLQVKMTKEGSAIKES